MSEYTDALKASQKKVTDLLAVQGQAIGPGLAKSEDMIQMGRPAFQSGAQDILGNIGAQYGLSPSIVQAGTQAQSQGLKAVDRTNQEAQDRARMAQKQRIQNLSYNTLFDSFVNSGQDLNNASANARQIALNQQSQDHQAISNDIARMNLIDRNNISRSYAAQSDRFSQNTSDPYEQAVIASLIGVGVQAPLAYGLHKSNQPKAPVTVQAPVAGQGGNAESVYDAYYKPKSKFAGMGE